MTVDPQPLPPMPCLTLNPLRWLLAGALAANALTMLFLPRDWYNAMPGVPYTGALNMHFVRDIGCAYLVSGIGLAWRAWRGPAAGLVALPGALFLLLHAGVHLGETLAGLCGWSRFASDVPAVVLPALAAAALALPDNTPTTRMERHD